MMKITTVVLMNMTNASSPDPGGYNHTAYVFQNIHSHLGLTRQVVYLAPAGFATRRFSSQFSPRRQPSRSRTRRPVGYARSR